ncbi:copper resistance CopC/CopD family protein [Kribbella sp.]|uniref:copper resistance CopC/CopD family protein n=1 Tax=Kribbella sp. TaxID=1871183 RepID=UPI002D79692E|nr:copper resistance protein CopC [Kribbella sp.]
MEKPKGGAARGAVRLRRRSWWIRPLLLTFVTAALWLTAGGVAEAHPVLLRSTPADGQTVQAAPRQIDLWFSEPPTAAGIEVSLSDRDGRAIPLGTPRIEDRGIHLVLSGFPTLSRSVYELHWSVVSKYDLHRLQGTLVFGVGQAATSNGVPAQSVTGPAATVLDVVLGWMDLSATAVLCGWAFLASVLARRPSPALPEPVAGTLLGLAVAFGFLSVVASLVRSGQQWSEARSSGSGLAILIDSGQLTRWALRDVAVIGVLVLLIRRLRGAPSTPSRPSGTALLVVFLLADLVLRSASSHAQSGPVSLLVLSAHQAAGLTWAGGLGLLALLTGQLRNERDKAFRFWRAFGPVATVCVAVLAVTGLLLAGRQVATVDAAIGTLYGKALLVKLAVVAVLMAFGLRSARGMHPWLTRQPARAPRTPSPRGQVIAPLLGVGILLFAVVLAVVPPARGPQFDKPEPVAARTAYQVDDLLITVALTPNTPGRSLLLVDAVSSRRPVPGPITGMTADLGAVTGLRLKRTQQTGQGGARWQSAVDVDATGELPLRIVVVRGNARPTTATSTWVVPGGVAPRPVLVSNSPITPWTNAAAAVLAVLALFLGAALARRRDQAAEGHELDPAGRRAGAG